MKSLQNHEVIINLELFKKWRFYQLFDPKSPKIFNCNVYKLLSVISSVAVFLFNSFSLMTFFDKDHKHYVEHIDLLLSMCVYFNCILTYLKIGIFVNKTDQVWNLFDLTRFDFLTSKPCRKNSKPLINNRKKAIKFLNLFYYFFIVMFIIWTILPILLNIYEDATDHFENIYNLEFPVDMDFYNKHFYMFYFMEVIQASYICYYTIMIDLFLISFCWATIAQYQVLTKSFEGIGYEAKYENMTNKDKEDYYIQAYEDLESVLTDRQKIFIKLKSFYIVMRSIVLLQVLLNAGSSIILIYSFIVMFISPGSFTIYSGIKVIVAYMIMVIELFMFCYLFEALNVEKESVNFGLYSCNWTSMDLKFQKLLLLKMRMNNANEINMKATPHNIINLQFFYNTITKTYNIVYFMLEALSHLHKI